VITIPISSIFDDFVIPNDEVMERFLGEEGKNTKGRKTPYIDIDEKIRKGREVLKNF